MRVCAPEVPDRTDGGKHDELGTPDPQYEFGGDPLLSLL
jgi:hypothetical protein